MNCNETLKFYKYSCSNKLLGSFLRDKIELKGTISFYFKLEKEHKVKQDNWAGNAENVGTNQNQLCRQLDKEKEIV